MTVAADVGVVAEALAESCDECRAVPGLGCRTRTDRPCGPHVARHLAATRRRARAKTAAAPVVEVCPSCEQPIRPTGECRCSD